MPLNAEDRQIVLSHLNHLLGKREYPKTICPSEIARALSSDELSQLGATTWRDTMPDIRTVVWELRDAGEVEICQRGEVLGVDVGVEDVRGPVRVRGVEGGKKEGNKRGEE